MSNPFELELAHLEAERKRLDALLDDAVAQYALVEEDMNVRMKAASPAQLQELMAERARIEESLGIAALVEAIDAIRERMALVRSAASAAA